MIQRIECYDAAAITASPTTMDVMPSNGAKGVKVVIDITAGSTLSLVFTIQGYDEISGKYWTVLASATLTGTGTTVLTVFPGATVTSNVSANDVLPTEWRVLSAHGNTNAATYTVVAYPIFF